MTDSAASLSPCLCEVMETLPDYQRYADAHLAYESESPYRLAIGRLLKEWGDRLLDIAEFQGNFLTSTHTRIIDNLVERITEIFALLNCNGIIQVDGSDVETQNALRALDGEIVRLLHETAVLADSIRRDDIPVAWMRLQSRAFMSRLRSLRREADARNELLGLYGG